MFVAQLSQAIPITCIFLLSRNYIYFFNSCAYQKEFLDYSVVTKSNKNNSSLIFAKIATRSTPKSLVQPSNIKTAYSSVKSNLSN